MLISPLGSICPFHVRKLKYLIIIAPLEAENQSCGGKRRSLNTVSCLFSYCRCTYNNSEKGKWFQYPAEGQYPDMLQNINLTDCHSRHSSREDHTEAWGQTNKRFARDYSYMTNTHTRAAALGDERATANTSASSLCFWFFRFRHSTCIFFFASCWFLPIFFFHNVTSFQLKANVIFLYLT